MAAVCPVVGTTNTTLPPEHPNVDLSKDGAKCPVVGATTEHHHNLSQHPSVDLPANHPAASTADAQKCPALNKAVQAPKSQAMDDKICPVVGTATAVLPPDHPSTAGKQPGDACPVTNATVGHHEGKVSVHPQVEKNAGEAVCPVTGQKGERH